MVHKAPGRGMGQIRPTERILFAKRKDGPRCPMNEDAKEEVNQAKTKRKKHGERGFSNLANGQGISRQSRPRKKLGRRGGGLGVWVWVKSVCLKKINS